MFNDIYEGLIQRKDKLVVIGLGYAGMPLACEFAKHVDTIGFDTDKNRIDSYLTDIDCSVEFTVDEGCIQQARFVIVVVPTPVDDNHKPDLMPLMESCREVGRNIRKDSIVVFESTVYPGATEKVCIPIIEEISGLKCGKDFKVGYSPERINPGDEIHTLKNTAKVVSGMDEETANEIARIYGIIVEGEIFKAGSIVAAEAIKVMENAQRDVNIAFMNEMAMICDAMGIDSREVIRGMNTKWNHLDFKPGLVGGHCLGVDPYYLIDEAERYGFNSRVMESSRQINEMVPVYIADRIIDKLTEFHGSQENRRVAILGLSYKENCSDIRNSKSFEICKRLMEKRVSVFVNDEHADKKLVKECYGIELSNIENIKDVDCVVVAVGHNEYRNLDVDKLFSKELPEEKRILFDIKGIYDKKSFTEKGIVYWSL